ncbi:MAG: DUF4286 family protein [Chitinophagaceae bacterium]|nr:DUF4286 family protein [Chitinophagaceae bacterium]
MFVYNVTITVETTIAGEWLRWLMQEHIPEVMATKCFLNIKFCECLKLMMRKTQLIPFSIMQTAKKIIKNTLTFLLKN